jgi:hypothetical protein
VSEGCDAILSAVTLEQMRAIEAPGVAHLSIGSCGDRIGNPHTNDALTLARIRAGP